MLSYTDITEHQKQLCFDWNKTKYPKSWNNKFWYTVASCWLFLYKLYYDARIHEHQVYKLSKFSCEVQIFYFGYLPSGHSIFMSARMQRSVVIFGAKRCPRAKWLGNTALRWYKTQCQSLLLRTEGTKLQWAHWWPLYSQGIKQTDYTHAPMNLKTFCRGQETRRVKLA